MYPSLTKTCHNKIFFIYSKSHFGENHSWHTILAKRAYGQLRVAPTATNQISRCVFRSNRLNWTNMRESTRGHPVMIWCGSVLWSDPSILSTNAPSQGCASNQICRMAPQSKSNIVITDESGDTRAGSVHLSSLFTGLIIGWICIRTRLGEYIISWYKWSWTLLRCSPSDGIRQDGLGTQQTCHYRPIRGQYYPNWPMRGRDPPWSQFTSVWGPFTDNDHVQAPVSVSAVSRPALTRF